LRRRPRATSSWSWVYRRTSRAQQSPAELALYIINFPQLIAGPIIRSHLIADQLDNRSVAFADIDIGVARFATDLAKKLLIANPDRRGRRNCSARRPPICRYGRCGWGCCATGCGFISGLLRLFRHGDRAGAHVRLPVSGELQLSLYRHFDPGFLATVAHDAVVLVPRLTSISRSAAAAGGPG
jgi:hypothetical protein